MRRSTLQQLPDAQLKSSDWLILMAIWLQMCVTDFDFVNPIPL